MTLAVGGWPTCAVSMLQAAPSRYIAADVVDQLELDSDGGMFCAYGDVRLLERLQAMIEPYLADGQRTTALIHNAEEAGFDFDD